MASNMHRGLSCTDRSRSTSATPTAPNYSSPGADQQAATGRTPRGALVPVAGARQAPGPGSQHLARAWMRTVPRRHTFPCPRRFAWAERKGGGSLIVPTKKRS